MKLATRFGYRNTNTVNAMGLQGHGAALGETDLRSYVPSIFAEQAHSSRSARYGYIPTIEVVRGLAREGFNPVFACEAKARDESKVGFTKHMIRFRRPTEELVNGRDIAARLGGCPEIVMINSHDGSTSYQFLAGFFRAICANGMVCGEGFGEVRVQHKGNVVEQAIAGAYAITQSFESAVTQADRMKAITLRDDEYRAYGTGCLHLKYYNEETQVLEAPVNEMQVLQPRRNDDTARDLWTTFNVAQENMIRGGLRGQTRDANGRRRRSTTRAVNGIDGNVKLNRALWTLTEKMAELVAR